MNELRQKLIKLLHEDTENNRKAEHERLEAEENKACIKKEVEDAERIAGLLNLQCEIKNRCKNLPSHCNMDLSKFGFKKEFV